MQMNQSFYSKTNFPFSQLTEDRGHSYFPLVTHAWAEISSPSRSRMQNEVTGEIPACLFHVLTSESTLLSPCPWMSLLEEPGVCEIMLRLLHAW